MSWRGVLRTVVAEQRRAEREARRRQRQLEQEAKQIEKENELLRDAHAVERYENYIDLLISVHKECGPVWDWPSIRDSAPPQLPTRGTRHEDMARVNLKQYKPSLKEKVLGHGQKHSEELRRAVWEGKSLDEKNIKSRLKNMQAVIGPGKLPGNWQDTRR